jgi:uncharacterized protein (PEP-CTERM system associated)
MGRTALLAAAATCVATVAPAQEFGAPAPTPPTGAAPPSASPYGLPPAPTAPGEVAGPPIFLRPILGLQEDYTDNARLTEGDKQSDFVTRAMAGLDGSVNLGRLQGSLSGSYAYDWYARDSAQNGKSVVASAAGTYSLLRDRLWIEADGTVTTGYTTTFGESAVNRSGVDGRAQVGIYRIGPQFQTTVGGVVDVAAAASFGQVFYSNADSLTAPLLPSDDNIYQVSGRIDTADHLGRLELLTTAQMEQDNHGFHTSNAVESFYYRVAPRVRVIARAGYESVYQTDTVDIDAPLLSAGFEFRPSPDSIITIEGGERYKHTAWDATVLLKLTRLATLSGYYRESFAPDQLYVAGSFADFVSFTASLPAPLIPTTLTPQENLYNEASFNKTGVVRLNLENPVNQVVFEANWTERRFVTTDTRDRTLTGYATYARKLRPDLTLVLNGNYGRTFASPIYTPSENYGGSATLLYAVNSTVDVRGSYAHTEGRLLEGAKTRYAENVVVLAITKRF